MISETKNSGLSTTHWNGTRTSMTVAVLVVVVAAVAVAGWYTYGNSYVVTQPQPAAQQTGTPPAK